MGMRKKELAVAVGGRRNRIAAFLAALAHRKDGEFAGLVFPVGAAAGHRGNSSRALAGPVFPVGAAAAHRGNSSQALAGPVFPVGAAAGHPGNSLLGLAASAAAERILARKIVNLHESGVSHLKGAERVSPRFLLGCFRLQTIRFRYLRIGAQSVLP